MVGGASESSSTFTSIPSFGALNTWSSSGCAASLRTSYLASDGDFGVFSVPLGTGSLLLFIQGTGRRAMLGRLLALSP